MIEAPHFASEPIIRELAINVKSLPNGIPPKIMGIVKRQADVYVDSQLSLVYTDWQILKLAPELVPEQAVIAASLIAAGRAESILYAVNTVAGKVNQYGIDLEQEGKAMIDDIVNSRMLVLGFYKVDPISLQSPEHEMRWTGGLRTQGWMSFKFSNEVAARPPSQSESDALDHAGYTERQVNPISDWYNMLGFELSYGYNPSWPAYVSEVTADASRLGITRIKGPFPSGISSALGQLAITLGQAGIRYMPQITPSSDPSLVTDLNDAGAMINEVEGPYLTSQSMDTEAQYRQVVERFHFAGITVSTPQFVGSTPELASMAGVADYVGFISTYQPLTPESTAGNLLYYSSRKNFSSVRGIPMLCDIGVDGSGVNQASYLFWAINKVLFDQYATGIQSGPITISEHVDESGSQFGLRSYSAGSWSDKTSMTLLARVKTMFGVVGGTKSTTRFKISGLVDPVITCWSLANGDQLVFLCSGLKSSDPSTSVSMRLLYNARVKFYLPTDGASEYDLGVGKSFTFNVTHKPVAILIQAT